MEDELLRRAKATAAENGESLTAFIEMAVRYQLSMRASLPGGDFDLPTFAGTGLRRGVDLGDGAVQRDLMDVE